MWIQSGTWTWPKNTADPQSLLGGAHLDTVKKYITSLHRALRSYQLSQVHAIIWIDLSPQQILQKIIISMWFNGNIAIYLQN